MCHSGTSSITSHSGKVLCVCAPVSACPAVLLINTGSFVSVHSVKVCVQSAELKKQRDFYQKLGMEVPGDIKGELCNMKAHLDLQRNGEVKSEDTAKEGEEKPEEDNDYHRSDEQVSICLECNSSKLRGLKRKWIRCSAQATVLHLKKFIAKKLNLTSFNELDILCNEEILGKDHTLKFVVVTRWRFKIEKPVDQGDELASPSGHQHQSTN
ncbi:Polycomb group RING finger protein 3 [Bagarius yarrelli]|uniref:Polycomb group RING finger protein 3 n=1 Tax=Bagarius yarrelli TaxID=175774 RepID=A0A556TRM2_BAGYA|nr:Polycomb group RING finger protein 3 [Bagarius yarrelli]